MANIYEVNITVTATSTCTAKIMANTQEEAERIASVNADEYVEFSVDDYDDVEVEVIDIINMNDKDD